MCISRIEWRAVNVVETLQIRLSNGTGSPKVGVNKFNGTFDFPKDVKIKTITVRHDAEWVEMISFNDEKDGCIVSLEGTNKTKDNQITTITLDDQKGEKLIGFVAVKCDKWMRGIQFLTTLT